MTNRDYSIAKIMSVTTSSYQNFFLSAYRYVTLKKQFMYLLKYLVSLKIHKSLFT